MNRVTWIRIGIVTAVVGVGTFAIWKAIDPGETSPKKNVAKSTSKKDNDKEPSTPGGAGSEVDPFDAASSSFGNRGGAVPASYLEPDGQDGGTGDRYSTRPADTSTDPFASRNMLPAQDGGGTTGTAYTAQSQAGDDRYGALPGSAAAGDTYDPASQSSGYGSATAGDGYGSTATSDSTTSAGNPLRGSGDVGADPFARTGDRYGASRDSDMYGSGDTSTTANQAQAGTTQVGDQGHDPFSSRREPAPFAGAGQSQSMTDADANKATSSGSDYFDRYDSTADSSTSSDSGYQDTPLPGQSQTGYPNQSNQYSAAQNTADQNKSTFDNSGYGTDSNYQNGLNGAGYQNGATYDPRQQPGPDYYGNTAAGTGSQTNGAQINNASSRTDGTQPGFDPFAEGVRPGGYAPTGYENSATMTGGYVDSGVGEPGDEMLEGPQSPQVIIQKSAPSEIQVGKPAIFEIVVRNDGDSVAHDVEVRDQVPRGTQLLRTSPQAQDNGRGTLAWALGNIPPREERVVKLELMPIAEGEIGSVATVHVAAAASVRTIATRPDLRLEVSAPPTVMIGDNVTLKIKVRNPGTGMAEGIVITERVPAELRHDAGDLLEYEIGQLEPGGTRELELTLTAAKAGKFINSLAATGDAGLQATEESRIEVIAPDLQIEMQGPNKRYLQRPATYTIAIANPGTAAAKDVELVAHVPQGMEFMEADNYGEYDQSSRVVRWSLEELPAAQQGAVSVKLLPTEAGEHRLMAEGSAQKDLFARSERALNVEGVAAILFEVVDVNDPIEAGAETTYEIRVLNQGSKVATNIQIEAIMPPEMRPIDGEGPTRAYVEGNRVTFEPLVKLAPRADTKYRIKAKGLQAGDLRLTVKLITQEMREPVIKEESTRVYADQ